MRYSITTCCTPEGIRFEPSGLASLGLVKGDECWAVWAEGRRFDDRSRLDTDKHWLINESPHLVVSRVHPDHWPTAFRLECCLERRPHEETLPPDECDAYLGLADALHRCGVNILFIQTAQVGYDFITVGLTCELPRLRPVAEGLLGRADQAGTAVARARIKHQSLPSDDPEAMRHLHGAADHAHRCRTSVFQTLGLEVIPRLLELEARLLVIENLRFQWQNASSAQALIQKRETMQKDWDPIRHMLVVGEQPPERPTPQQREEIRHQFISALSAGWFLNRRVVEAGENSYYLAYHNVADRDSSREPPKRGSVPPREAGDTLEDLSPAELDVLFDWCHTTLAHRPLSTEFHDIIPPPDLALGGADTASSAMPISGTAERLGNIRSAKLYERWALVNFFSRQALYPVRVSALPVLAYARFWALGAGDGRPDLIRLRYDGRHLRPVPDRENGVASMAGLVSFLNRMTRVGEGKLGPHGLFDDRAVVFANVDMEDQCLRLRFVRRQKAEDAYLSLRVAYRSDAEVRERPLSQGLLATVTHLVVRQGLRVDRIHNSLTESDSSHEKGSITLVLRASTPHGLRTCALCAEDSHRMEEKWERELRSQLSRICLWKELNLTIERGVPLHI